MKNPESHPRYKNEWCSFWERRYREVEKEGKDPGRHDFKSEWIIFWKNRMQQLCEEEYRQRRQDLLKKHKIDDPDQPSFKSPQVQQQIDDSSMSRPPRPYSSAVPFQPPPATNTGMTATLKQPMTISDNGFANDSQQKNQYEADFTVVGTLKLLTDLEDQLGSLTESVKELLKKAIDITVKGGKPINLFEDTEHAALLSLSTTKLKSQIQSGILGDMVAARTKMAIESATWLMSELEKMPKARPPRQPPTETKMLTNVSQMSTSVSHLGINVDSVASATVGKDTVEIAQYIAQQLLNVGKSDASEVELQNILRAVSERHVAMISSGEGLVSTVGSQRKAPFAAPALFPSGRVDPPPPPDDPPEPGKHMISGGLSALQSAYEEEKTLDSMKLEDLQEMLSNFRSLGPNEQEQLTLYLKKLEATDSKKVTQLRALMQHALRTPSEPASNSAERNPSSRSSDGIGGLSMDKPVGINRFAPPSLNKPATSSFADFYHPKSSYEEMPHRRETVFSSGLQQSSFGDMGRPRPESDSFRDSGAFSTSSFSSYPSADGDRFSLQQEERYTDTFRRYDDPEGFNRRVQQEDAPSQEDYWSHGEQQFDESGRGRGRGRGGHFGGDGRDGDGEAYGYDYNNESSYDDGRSFATSSFSGGNNYFPPQRGSNRARRSRGYGRPPYRGY